LAITALRRPAVGHELQNDIVRQIRTGKLVPGDQLRSATDLAKDYGVAYVTAHKAIQRLAEEGYCVRVAGKGTFVSDGFKSSGITSVGIPAYFQHVPFHAHMVEELTFQAAARGIKAVVGRGEDTPRLIERMLRCGVRAMIRFPGCNCPREPLDEQGIWRVLKREGIATVVINNYWFDNCPFPTVSTDAASGVTEMMDHLISLGHRNILLIDELARLPQSHAIEAYRKALLDHGLPYDRENVAFLCPPDWPEAGEIMLDRMLDRSTAAIAICGDYYAPALLQGLKRRGVTPGKDYSLASFDGTSEAEKCGMTSIVPPVSELVANAYEMLDEKSQKDPRQVLLKPQCVFRSSTGPAPKRPRTTRSNTCECLSSARRDTLEATSHRVWFRAATRCSL